MGQKIQCYSDLTRQLYHMVHVIVIAIYSNCFLQMLETFFHFSLLGVCHLLKLLTRKKIGYALLLFKKILSYTEFDRSDNQQKSFVS